MNANSQRRQREIERTRTDILNAAARAFLKKGHSATTMSDIAAEAGYTAPSLYTYFKNKDAIFEAFEEFMQEAISNVFSASLPAGLTFKQQLAVLLQRMVDLVRDSMDILQAFFFILPSGDGMVKFSDMLENWVRGSLKMDHVGEYDATVVAYYITGVLYATFVRWVRSANDTPIESLLPSSLDLIFSGIGRETEQLAHA